MAATTTKGIDAIPALLYSENEELRVSSITRMATLRQEIAADVARIDDMFRSKEQEMLAAVADWRKADTPQERAGAAHVVGRLQRDLAELDMDRQKARYPHRYIQEQTLERSVINPDTQDKRKIVDSVMVSKPMIANASDRLIAVDTV